jgi:hypothetical protein
VIRIRYKDLAPGLHGKVEHRARGLTVYLLPGLTGKQRKAVLRRLRQEASRGCGPALPAPQLTVALGADWIRTKLRNTAAVVRLHPVGSLLPAVAACALITLFVVASGPVRIVRVPGSVPAGSGSAGSGLVTVPVPANPAVRGSGSVSEQPVADPGAGEAGGGTGLGFGARSGSGARGASGAGSGSTSGSKTGSRHPPGLPSG